MDKEKIKKVIMKVLEISCFFAAFLGAVGLLMAGEM